MKIHELLQEMSQKAAEKMGVTVSRVTKKDFKEIKDKLSKILLAVGVKHADWTMGGAGIWDETHPYYDPNNKKKDSGDIDVMLDEKDVQRAFSDKDIKGSKQQLSQALTEKGIKNNGASLNCVIEFGQGKYAQVDLIVKPDAAAAIKGHQMDYSTDPNMRGADLWLEIWPTLVKMTPSPISGKTEIVDAKGKTNSALQLSPDKGVVDRETGKVIISWADKDGIAKLMVGTHASARDISSLSGLERVLKVIPKKWNAVKHLFPQSK